MPKLYYPSWGQAPISLKEKTNCETDHGHILLENHSTQL